MQLDWQYLQRTVPGVDTLVGPIEEALREKLFPALIGVEQINSDFCQILGYSVKHVGLGIPDPWLSAESTYNTYKAASGELLESLLGDFTLKYVGHRACIHRESAASQREIKYVELAIMDEKKELASGQDMNRLHRATRNWA